METKIVYFDETGDDGLNTKSSDTFILTSVYMPCGSWQDNYNIIRAFRCNLKKNTDFTQVRKCIPNIFSPIRIPTVPTNGRMNKKQRFLKNSL